MPKYIKVSVSGVTKEAFTREELPKNMSAKCVL